MNNVNHVSIEQYGDVKSGISRSKNSTILQAQCASALFCSNIRVKVQLSSLTSKCDHFVRFLWLQL